MNKYPFDTMLNASKSIKCFIKFDINSNHINWQGLSTTNL